MSQLDDRISDFLSQKRIAIAGVSRSKPGAASLIYRKFKDLGYQVFAFSKSRISISSSWSLVNGGGVAAASFFARISQPTNLTMKMNSTSATSRKLTTAARTRGWVASTRVVYRAAPGGRGW